MVLCEKCEINPIVGNKKYCDQCIKEMSGIPDGYDVIDYAGDATVRFVLRTKGNNPLLFIGKRPAAADRYKPDPTLSRIMEYSSRQKDDSSSNFNGIAVINSYPLRIDAVSPKKDSELVQLNVLYINKILHTLHNEIGKITLWAAWGADCVNNRKQFSNFLEQFDGYKCTWKTAIPNGVILLSGGHPYIPARMSYDWKFVDFDIESYKKKWF